MTYEYDASGIRQSETQSGLTTHYLTDPNRDYAQVIEESFDLNSFAEVKYSYGDDLLSQHRRVDAITTDSSTYHYDGLGSTRFLSGEAGTETDSYDFTAFGELEASTGVTVNDYLFTGEQFDPNLGFYYLRARYYNPGIGRFHSMDTFAGRMFEPITLHKYLYANANPVNMVDPSGLVGMAELTVGLTIVNILTSLQINNAFTVFDDLGIQDSRIETARTINRIWAVANLGAAGVSIWKIFSKKFARRSDDLARQIGESKALVFLNRSAASQIVRRGAVTRRELESFIPPNTSNTFKPSKNLPEGNRHNFTVDGNRIEIWWHPKNPTARIKRNNEILGVDGNWYSGSLTKRELALTHIPFVN